MKHFFQIMLAMLLLSLPSCQEDTIEPDVFGSLSGEVLLESDNSAMTGVTISTSPSSNSVLTDSQGKFKIENLKTGSYLVRAEKTGYKTVAQNVTISEKQTTSVVIKMKPENLENSPPEVPSNPSPKNGEEDLSIAINLAWEAADSDDDSLTFDLYLFSSQNPATLLAEDLAETNFQVGNLKYGTTYFWQVVVKDGIGDAVYGPVWSFSTKPFPAHPFVFARVNNAKYDIFCAPLANEFYQLTDDAGSNYRPRISPDGNRIAFLSNIFPNTQIFTMKRDGAEIKVVPAPEPIDGYNKFDLDFAWSPDGTKLIYMRYNKLFKINLDGSGFAQFAEIASPETFVEVDWTAQGNKIAARTAGLLPYQSKILLYDSGGNFLQEVVGDIPGSIGGPAFSIDGASILFTHDVSGFESPDGRQLDAHIFLKNITTGNISDLSVNKEPGTNDLDPRFSPDGSKVIFVNTSNVPNAQKNILVMNLQGLGRTVIFENSEMPDWR